MKNPKRKDKNKESLFNRIVAWVHLWPSIVSGVVVVFVCVTGTIIVYGDEIMDFTAGDARYVKAERKRITSDQIMTNMEKSCPGYKVSEFTFYKDPERSVRIRAFNPKERKLSMVYMNPYTGEVLKNDKTIYFFFITAHLHGELLAGEVGHWIVLISTIIFVISCITGLVLWWPKRWNRTTRLASFTVRWKARFKRLNYDLHNVFGFYSLLLALVLGFTGLMIVFNGLMSFTIKTFGVETADIREVLPKMDTTRSALDMVPFAYRVLEQEQEHLNKEMVSIGNYNQQKMGAYVFITGTRGLKSYENADIDVYDRYTGEKIQIDTKYIAYEKAENNVWQLHMGQWWGQIGKFTTFMVGIISTSLPITGFIIWWGRRNKKKKPVLAKNPKVKKTELEHA